MLAALRGLARVMLAMVILFQEWGWAPLHRAMAVLGRLPVLRHLEAAVAKLPPYAALAICGLPALALLPVKLAAVWLIGTGRPVLGLAVIVLAKVLGTALVARLFALTHPTLMTLPWFARLYARWMPWKAALLRWVRGSALWRSARRVRLAVRRMIQRALRGG